MMKKRTTALKLEVICSKQSLKRERLQIKARFRKTIRRIDAWQNYNIPELMKYPPSPPQESVHAVISSSQIEDDAQRFSEARSWRRTLLTYAKIVESFA